MPQTGRLSKSHELWTKSACIVFHMYLSKIYILLIVEVGFLIESCPGILMFTLSFIPFGSHRATFLKESGLRRSYLGLRSPLPPPPPELGRRCSGALILLLLLISAAFCPHGGCAAAAAATAGGLFSSDDSSGDSAS